MRYRVIILTVIALVASLSASQPLHADEAPLKLTISADKKEAYLYEPVTITMKLENITNQAVDILDPAGHEEHFFQLHDSYPIAHPGGFFTPIRRGYCYESRVLWGGSRFPLCPASRLTIQLGKCYLIKKTFIPKCDSGSVTLDCTFTNTQDYYHIIHLDLSTGESERRQHNLENPFIGSLFSNEVTVAVNPNIYQELAEKYANLESTLTGGLNSERDMFRAINNWRVLECSYFDEEIWRLSLGENLGTDVKKGLWHYLLHNLDIGLGWDSFDYLLDNIEELWKHRDLHECMFDVLRQGLSVGTHGVYGYNFSYGVDEELAAKTTDALERFKARYAGNGTDASDNSEGGSSAGLGKSPQRDAPAEAAAKRESMSKKPCVRGKTHLTRTRKAKKPRQAKPPSDKKSESNETSYFFIILALLVIIPALLVLTRKRVKT